MNIDLRLGDCLEVLKTIPDNSVDSVVTDPPYHLTTNTSESKGFMGKEWDGGDIAFRTDVWEECLRILKPGGHLLSFSHSRTYHRMGVAIEDAGFEIRDQIMWVYAQGFPKSHNIGKKVEGYEGWGTALKPAHEPIVMARKPLSEKSIAENVLKHGTGGINIDGSRIEAGNDYSNRNSYTDRETNSSTFQSGGQMKSDPNELGRFPANIIFDEEAGQLLDEQSGISKSGKNKLEKGTGGIWNKGTNLPIGPEYGDKGGASRFFYCPKTSKKDRNEGLDDEPTRTKNRVNPGGLENDPRWAPIEVKNHHPTVKPTDLMRYLINLVTPPNGTTLDPFMGSGSTGKASIRCGVNFIGIEKEQEYMDIAKARIEHEQNKPVQQSLF